MKIRARRQQASVLLPPRLRANCLGLCLLLAVHALRGTADDAARLDALFAAARAEGGTVTLPPGDYNLDGSKPIALPSRTRVIARGARFHLPERLGDKARVVLFAGENLRDFTWEGGHFTGHVFDPARTNNTWEPNVNTRPIVLTTTRDGGTANIAFRGVSSEGVAGAAISVYGAEQAGSERGVARYALNVSVEDCKLLRSGKFMWDYGYLWQIMVWPEAYGEAERAMAKTYFDARLIRGPVSMADGDDRVMFDNRQRALPVSKVRPEAVRGHDAVCFFGDALPSNIQRGKQYFVVDSADGYIRVADRPGGAAVKFAGAAGPQAQLIHDLSSACPALFAPTGAGPGKGAFDLVGCSNVLVRGCTLSALGDTMHIQKSCDITFERNRITGSRMGAFFLAEFCQRALIVSNTVDGTNGSRVMSIEKSAEDVKVIDNVFVNGGRGTWINQPRRLLLQGNVFSNNTTKCEHNMRRGRKSFVTGDFERYAEIYVTTYEPQGRYGEVRFVGNRIVTGPEAQHALTFAPGGDGILVESNAFLGPVRSVPPAAGCSRVTVRNNAGIDDGAPVATGARARRVEAVMGVPGCVAFWDFVKREPAGARRFTAHVPAGSDNVFALDAGNYVKDYWGEGREASYADFPLLGRGPFGQAVGIRRESDATFRPLLFVPRARLQDSPLDIKGEGKSVTVVVWAIRESGNHALAGIWHEGTDLKQQETASIRKVERGQRQYALFAGLNKPGSACGHVSENGASSFLNRYALHKCNSAELSPSVPADSPPEVLDRAWQCFAMTFDDGRDEITGWLNGKSGDRWQENPKADALLASAYQAWLQGHLRREPGLQAGEDPAFPESQLYCPPEEEAVSVSVLNETAEERVEVREYGYTRVRACLRKDAGGAWRVASRDLVALRLNPWWYPHGIYTPAPDGSGGPFTIGRVIHSARGVGFTGWIGGVAVFNRALSADELASLSAICGEAPASAP